jgi:dihydrofolate reductase
MAKVILYIAQTLDGFIADQNGEVKFLDQFENDSGDYGYAELMEKVDTIFMGKKTYDQILSFGVWPYLNKKTFVFSRSQEVQKIKYGQVINQNIEAFADDYKEQNQKSIWLVGGSQIVKYFNEKNLIDEYIITTIPIILGSGIKLFEPYKKDFAINLKLSSSVYHKNGLVQSTYIKL